MYSREEATDIFKHALDPNLASGRVSSQLLPTAMLDYRERDEYRESFLLGICSRATADEVQ